MNPQSIPMVQFPENQKLSILSKYLLKKLSFYCFAFIIVRCTLKNWQIEYCTFFAPPLHHVFPYICLFSKHLTLLIALCTGVFRDYAFGRI